MLIEQNLDLEKKAQKALDDFQKGLIEQSCKDVEEALMSFPHHYNLKFVYQLILTSLHQTQKAEKVLRELIELRPDIAAAYSYLGKLLVDQSFFQEGITYLQLYLEKSHDDCMVTYSLLGSAYRYLGDPEKAIFYLEKCRHDPRTFFNRSIAYLMSGRFKEGWALFDSRFEIGSPSANHTKEIMKALKAPLWKGESLEGRHIVIYAEQGNGDTIQFARYLLWLVEEKCRITFLCPLNLIKLIQYSFPFETISYHTSLSHHIQDIDYQLPLMSLPFFHQTTRETIPYPKGYFKTPISSSFFTKTSQMKVGIFFQGSQEHKRDSARSLPFSFFSPLILKYRDKIQFYSLQKGFGEEQIEGFDEQLLIPLGSKFFSFTETAQAIQELDLVLSVDSSVAHLCGALGKPVWILLTEGLDWRWFLHESGSPWYSHARLFRRNYNESWENVYNNIISELDKTLISYC